MRGGEGSSPTERPRMKQHPVWLIDDTSGISDARVFIAHLAEPRFVGELMPDDEHDPSGLTIACPLGQTLCRIVAMGPQPLTVTDGMIDSLHRAILHHDTVRGS